MNHLCTNKQMWLRKCQATYCKFFKKRNQSRENHYARKNKNTEKQHLQSNNM